MREGRKLLCAAAIAGLLVTVVALTTTGITRAVGSLVSGETPSTPIGLLLGIGVYAIGLGSAAGFTAMAGSHFGATAATGNADARESIAVAFKNWRRWLDWVLPVGLVTLARGVTRYSQIGAIQDKRRYYVHPVLVFEQDVSGHEVYQRSEQLDSKLRSTPYRGAVFELQCASGFGLGLLLTVGIGIWALINTGGNPNTILTTTKTSLILVPSLGGITTTTAILSSGIRRGQVYHSLSE